MVKWQFYIIGLLLLLPSFSVAAPQLLFNIDKTEIQLGHHINAKLYGVDLQKKLASIDLSDLKEKFGVTIEETTEAIEYARWPNQSVQVSYLKLYPRQTGNLEISELRIDGKQSKQQTILVTSGIKKSRIGDTNIERDIKISSTQPWERQQVIIEVEVEAADSFSSLSSEDLKIPGFETYSIPPSTEKILRDGVEHLAMRTGWVLLPLSTGQFSIDVPPIKYQKSGRTERVYYFPKQTINVKALPPYIPPTMPVGKIHIETTLKSDKLLFPGILSFWNITLLGSGVSPNWIPPVLRQIKSNNDINVLPINTKRSAFANKSEERRGGKEWRTRGAQYQRNTKET